MPWQRQAINPPHMNLSLLPFINKNLLCILDRKQTQIKHNTSRFTWFPKTGYVHGGSRLYIIGGMIQTLNSTKYNPTKPSVSLLHSVFLSNLHYFHSHSCTIFFFCTLALTPSLALIVSIYRRKESRKESLETCH
jgi:hypothetical protein